MKTKVLVALLIIGIVSISGCVKEEVPPAEKKECEVVEDCPSKICFAKACIDNKCSYSKLVPCPECDDKDECTEDSFDYDKQECINEQIIPCCGNGECETEETYSNCPQDCPTPKDVLEESIPEIKEYPKLEEVFIDLYVPFKFITWVGFDYSECQSGFFTEEEIEFMKIFLEIYKENPKLKDYPKDTLYYFASWCSGDTTYYDFNFFSTTLREKALSLKSDDDLTTAGNIYDFVKEHITGRERIMEYSSARSLDEVKTIWQYKTGKCAEHAYLMTALLRAAGIPTRIVSSDLVGLTSHLWVEIYSNNQWIPIPSTGVLDSDKDRKIDLQEYPVLDAVIAHDLSKAKFLECVALAFVPKSFIGYKYTDDFSEILLSLAEDNEFKNTALDYISKWKASRTWKEREEFGKIAFENSVAAIFGEEKPVYTWLDVDVPFGFSSREHSKRSKANLFPENEIVIIGLESHYKMTSTSSFFRELLELNENKKIDFIVIKEEFNEAVLLDYNDINQLPKIYDDFKQDSDLNRLLVQFVETIKNIEESELSETDFLLPAVDYDTFVLAVGTITEEGYKYWPLIGGYEEIKGLVFRFETLKAYKDFKYIKFVNKEGEIIFEPKSNGYYETCPAGLQIPFDQTLNIRKEGNYIVIQGEMHLEE